MVGAALFAIGSFPLYFNTVDGHIVGITFFVGSLFFTSAAFLQLAEAVEARSREGSDTAGHSQGGWRVWAWQPSRIDFWATSIQFAGTLLFNISTFSALLGSLDADQERRLVWAPDMFGAAAFLLASYLGFAEVCHRAWCWRDRSVSWWIVVLNLTGSIAFGVAAIAAFVLPTTGELLNITLVNIGTFVGAVCFFIGAYLLLPESSSEGSSYG
jgi:hypothetical protein